MNPKTDPTRQTLIDVPKGQLDPMPDRIVSVPAATLVSWSNGPRETFVSADMNALVDSIRERGQLTPLTVRKADRPGEVYEVIDGERRFRAGVLAKLSAFRCIVRDLDDRTAFDLALQGSDAGAPYTFLDRLRQVGFLMSPEGGKRSPPEIAQKIGCSVARVSYRQTLISHLSKEARAEAVRMVEGRPAPGTPTAASRSSGGGTQQGDPNFSNSRSSGVPESKNDETSRWQLTEDQLNDVTAINRAEGQVAALRLIERLSLKGQAAKKAIEWVGAGKDPDQFGAKGEAQTKKPAWDPSVPDGDFASKLPPTVSARANGNGKATVSFKVPAHFAQAVVGGAMDALEQVNAKLGRGDSSSPYRAALPRAIEAAVEAEKNLPKKPATPSAPRKSDARSLEQLAKKKEEKAQLEAQLTSKLELLLTQGSAPFAEMMQLASEGRWIELSKRVLRIGTALSVGKEQLAQTTAASAKKVASLDRQIARLAQKVGETKSGSAAPSTSPSARPAPAPVSLTDQAKANGAALAQKLASDPKAREEVKKGLEHLLALAKGGSPVTKG